LTQVGNVDGAPPMKVLMAVLQACYSLEVCALPKPIPKREVAALERVEGDEGYGPQIETPSAHALLHRNKPRDAFAIVGYTMEDLCNTQSGFGFLVSMAPICITCALDRDTLALITPSRCQTKACTKSCGLQPVPQNATVAPLILARLGRPKRRTPASQFGEAQLDKGAGIFSFARYSDGAPSPARLLRRCALVLCHEVGHLFGIKHCIWG